MKSFSTATLHIQETLSLNTSLRDTSVLPASASPCQVLRSLHL